MTNTIHPCAERPGAQENPGKGRWNRPRVGPGQPYDVNAMENVNVDRGRMSNIERRGMSESWAGRALNASGRTQEGRSGEADELHEDEHRGIAAPPRIVGGVLAARRPNPPGRDEGPPGLGGSGSGAPPPWRGGGFPTGGTPGGSGRWRRR